MRPFTHFMNTIENQAGAPAHEESASTARPRRVAAVAWLTGITAVIALATLSDGASVGMGLGVIGVSGMVTAVSYFILRD